MIRPSPGLSRHQARWHATSCTIRRPSGPPTFNPGTGTYTPAAPTTIYTGGCMVTPEGSNRVQDFGDGPVVTRSYEVQIADTTVDALIEDTVTVTASTDPLLIGLELRIIDIPKSELITVRRLVCEEVLT